ncbi:hypothetical protein FTO74_03595 [Granulicella sp. WH15]|uniref:TonB-dependent receptor n=1 Tax=Granulicella sp. WH15 TaxID=2602070 RepID=UPI001366DB92|nr:carboxypeptidase regulatory-like domain-containing protein [Granulicella sp. WH15]QHN02555.1 hypothetical protein FTO74_03595 [Granulicella sp. WH15]
MQHTKHFKVSSLSQLFHQLVVRRAGFILALALCLFGALSLHAQTTATLSGSVQDATGALVPNATITLTNEASKDVRTGTSNGDGVFVFPALLPSSYSVKVTATGFAGKEITGIVLHAGDSQTLPAFALAIGTTDTAITVETADQILSISNGERTAVLEAKDIEDLTLQGRDTSELLKVLPGVVNVANGPTNNTSGFNPTNITAGQSAIGSGLNVGGAPNRGGTALLLDGINILDIGNNASSLVTISPEMTQEISVLTTNFGADTEFGPVVISAISKSGGDKYHGQGYFNARNDVLNANDWQSNHQGLKKGGAHYYYPGGSIGGPVPFTHDKLFFWGGTEILLQNQGNASTLQSFIPTPAMLNGDFSSDDAANAALCPGGFNSASSSTYWCSSLAGTTFLDGAGNPVTPTPVAGASGYKIPSSAINQNMLALTKLWPKANANPSTTPGGYNYVQPVINVNNGWIYRIRVDYNPSEKDKFFISYQQGYSKQLAQGNGAHIYSTPNYAIPFPGGGLSGTTYSKGLAGHWVHTFNATTTNEFVAAWTYGYIPYGAADITADYRSAVGYNQSFIYGGGASKLVPTYSAPSAMSIPDYSQRDYFEYPGGLYPAKKQIPQYTDNLTKVIGNHTFKFGGFTENVDNYQGNMAEYPNGGLTIATNSNPNFLCTSGTCPNIGSFNGTANFITGTFSAYREDSSDPIQDLAYQIVSGYVDDSWKATKRLSVELGFRFDHIGHFYDRQGIGIAAFFPGRVLADYESGKVYPGFYWHGIDPGVPKGGAPDRLAFISPRFGVSYDVFGNGKTMVHGGWGAYRFPNQYNDSANALITAQAIVGYNSTSNYSGKTFQQTQIGSLQPPTCFSKCLTTTAPTGFDASDYGTPLTYDWNFSIDQQLPGRFLLDVAYVGNSSSKLLNSSQTIAGSSYTGIANVNKTPLGAYFQPISAAVGDNPLSPNIGLKTQNPENLGQGGTGITASDYRPYGYAYGANSVTELQSTNYANYNSLQAAVLKRTGNLTINANFTWSKALGTVLARSPYNNRLNYGPQPTDRPYVFNSSYIYRLGKLYHGNKLVEGTVNGWTISGVSSWQIGTFLQPTVSVTYAPGTSPYNTASTSLTTASYFGTDAGSTMPILPVVTCNPLSGLAFHQSFKQSCLVAPNLGQQGGQNFPYIKAASFLENDLAVYKTFNIHGGNNIQFRVSAFNWLNHPLPQFSASTQYQINYTVNGKTGAVTQATQPATVGFFDSKNGAPGQRNIELDVKYTF